MLLNADSPAPAPLHPPSEWVARWAARLAPEGARPRALDLACGSGRHAMLLAARGARVTAVDRDAGALAELAFHAQAAGLSEAIERRVADLESPAGPWPLAGERFDVVVVTHYLWRPRFDDLLATVGDDGLLLYETFADGQQQVGRPSSPEFLLRPGELLGRLREGWRVLAYEDLRLDAPDRFVQRVLARRQGA